MGAPTTTTDNDTVTYHRHLLVPDVSTAAITWSSLPAGPAGADADVATAVEGTSDTDLTYNIRSLPPLLQPLLLTTS